MLYKKTTIIWTFFKLVYIKWALKIDTEDVIFKCSLDVSYLCTMLLTKIIIYGVDIEGGAYNLRVSLVELWIISRFDNCRVCACFDEEGELPGCVSLNKDNFNNSNFSLLLSQLKLKKKNHYLLSRININTFIKTKQEACLQSCLD